MTLVLSKSELVQLWEESVLSTTAYVYLALQYDNKDATTTDLNLEDFADDWAGTENEKGKQKKLTGDQIIKSLADLQKRQKLQIQAQQLSLNLF